MELEALTLLMDIAIIMFAALFFGLVAHKVFGQPAILGYLFAGIAIGPVYGLMSYYISGGTSDPALGLITDNEEISSLASLGVSLLLFAVGLEFSSKRVGRILKVSAITGTIEMVFMFCLGSVVGVILGWTMVESLLLGAMLMISSTIIIIKMLGETGQRESLHGRLLVGRLVVEDIGAIVVITLITGLLVEGALGFAAMIPVLIGIVFLIIMLLVGKRVFPHFIEKISKARSKELFLLAIFGICIGTAVISEFFGLSLALGAFLAGMILSESEHNLDIVNQIRPLKDIFLIIFFVSVGMTIDLSFLLNDPAPIILTIIVIITTLFIGKALANTLATRIMGFHAKTSILVGMSMMQIGEFSFIIATLGYTNGILRDEMYSIILITALISMVFTPYAMRLAPGVYGRLSKYLKKTAMEEWEEGDASPKFEPDILILGFAEVVQDTVKCLEITDQSFLVIDYSPKKVREMQERDIQHIRGDASNEEILEIAGVESAKLIIVALSDMVDAETAIQLCHKHNKDAYVIARAYNDRDREALGEFANDIIISEDVAGRRLAWHVLKDLGFEDEAIKRDIEIADPEAVGESF